MKPLLAIAGPTASGKTEVVLELSRLIPIEAITCDSMQVYKDMPILTQAASAEIQKAFPNHLASFLQPETEFNASLFRRSAEKLVAEISARKKVPVIVGGTGLYLRALLDGLFEGAEGTPDRNENLRNDFIAEEKEGGPGTLYKKLKEKDPSAAEKIHSNDVRRIVRALEVFTLTGRPMSEQKTNRKGIRGDYDTKIFFLERDRADLYERVNARVEQMFSGGLLEEVKSLEGRALSKTAEMALGLREVRAYLKKEKTLEEAKDMLKTNTRHYAKRQVSWFRHETGVISIKVAPNDKAAVIAERILEKAGLSS